MKYFYFFILIISLPLSLKAQLTNYPERIVDIAILENDKANILDFSQSDLAIVSKIKRIFNLKNSKIQLINQTLEKDPSNGWFLQYEFKFDTQAGIYREFLTTKGNKLVITETRNAVMALASNCNKVELTNDENRSKCADKKNGAFDSEIVYRLFTSNR